ncbi:ribonuclease P protein subunit p29 [Xylariomycetidae sp. FL2044]|nr:ribonuclease P protein subunit p29 [Xylariomycetidae sp. FL2044]
MASKSGQALTQELLLRAHSPDSANRIYSDKIQHRPLFLKPTSPPPNARDARRKARLENQKRTKALKPKPLSSRQRRKLGLHHLPTDANGRKYAIFEPLHQLWLAYIREILGSELHQPGQGAAAKLSAADFHGALVHVTRSTCPSRVGIQGIIIKDSRFVFEVITIKNTVKIVPKEGTMFQFHVPAKDSLPDKRPFTFELHGDQFQHRSADRANKKFKAHYLKYL